MCNICEYCREEKEDVEYVANPYDSDIHGEINMQWLCKECQELLLYEI